MSKCPKNNETFHTVNIIYEIQSETIRRRNSLLSRSDSFSHRVVMKTDIKPSCSKEVHNALGREWRYTLL